MFVIGSAGAPNNVLYENSLNLFRKTDTNRQADLVRVLLSVPLRTNVE